MRFVLDTNTVISGLLWRGTEHALMCRYLDVVLVVAPADIAPVVRTDPDDDQVLACALAARADLIVSGDPHLRNLKSYQGIPIVAAAEGLRRIEPR